MIQILICDDDAEQNNTTKSLLDNILKASTLGDVNFNIDSTTSPSELLGLAAISHPDILILDIHMPEMNGLDIAQTFNSEYPQTKVIFLTSYEQFVFYSLRFSPFRFVRKDEMNSELPEAIDSALKSILNVNSYLVIKKYSSRKIVLFNDIRYLEKIKYKNEVNIFCRSEIINSRETIKLMEDKLCKNGFVKVNSGTVANLKYISQIKKYDLILTDGTVLKISSGCLDTLKKELSKYMYREI